MARKRFNEKTFSFSVGNNTYTVTAYSTCGKEVCECKELGIKGVYSFYNRPWQEFTYDIALSTLAKKAKSIGGEFVDALNILHDKVGKNEIDEAENMFNSFEKVYNASSDKTKEMLKDTTLNSKDDVKTVTMAIGMMNALGI